MDRVVFEREWGEVCLLPLCLHYMESNNSIFNYLFHNIFMLEYALYAKSNKLLIEDNRPIGSSAILQLTQARYPVNTMLLDRVRACYAKLDTPYTIQLWKLYCIPVISKVFNEITIEDVITNSDKNWDWEMLSCHPNITMACIEQNIHFPWKWGIVSKNPHLNISFVARYSDKDWDFALVSKHVNISMQDIINHPSLPWNYKSLSAHPKLTTEMFKQFPKKKWCMMAIGSNKNMDINVLLKGFKFKKDVKSTEFLISLAINPNLTILEINRYPEFINHWNWCTLSRNPGITMQAIINHPTYDWHWDSNGLPVHPHLSMEVILAYPHEPKNWIYISRHANITMDDIIAHSELPWVFTEVSRNPNFNIQIVLLYPEAVFHWSYISMHNNITMQDIIDHPTFPWDWNAVTMNPNFNLNIITHFPNQRWNWYNITGNAGITLSDIMQNKQYPWVYNVVITKEYKLDQELYVDNVISNILLVNMLQEGDTIPDDTVSHVVCNDNYELLFSNEYIIYNVSKYV